MSPLMKALGPAEAVGGLGATALSGGSLAPVAMPIAMSGLSSMTGPGGILAPSTPGAAMPSIKAPALSSAPIGPPAMPDIPGPAGSGLSLSVPGAGASPGAGAGPNSDITNLIAQAMGTGGGGNPFAAFGS
jgi:hypothetical protein